MGDTPSASSESSLRRMQRQPQVDTQPETALRRELHRQGLRYRVNAAPLPGVRRRADVVFPRAKVAVFVDGCFWHACPMHASWPKANADWWRGKLGANVERDRETDVTLSDAGWHAVRVWEHEDPVDAAARIREVVLRRQGGGD